MTYSSRASLRIFRKLCGRDAYSRVILGTTFWDVVLAATAEAREEELLREFWSTMVQEGSPVARILPDRKSSLQALKEITQRWREDSMPLRIKTEVLQGGGGTNHTSVAETSAFPQAVVDSQGRPTGQQVGRLRKQWKAVVQKRQKGSHDLVESVEANYAEEIRQEEERLNAAISARPRHDKEVRNFWKDMDRLGAEHSRAKCERDFEESAFQPVIRCCTCRLLVQE